MHSSKLRVTYIGGPTALLEFGGARILTDPTFDPAGSEYTSGPVTLSKTASPAITADRLDFEFVLLSHDHYFDNLDRLGRNVLSRANQVLTTTAGAQRLGGNAMGLAPGESVQIHSRNGARTFVTATPARHGPADHDRGPVIGFVLQESGDLGSAVYVSGDTVWYEDIAGLRDRFPIRTAILFMGAARPPGVGPWNVTMTAAEALQFARTFPEACIIPLHFEGWRHFTESRSEISAAFVDAGLNHRLRWLSPGTAVDI
jgi:L-ascorbate metabolism protein UlaG (beta-lactamase superfamily)